MTRATVASMLLATLVAAAIPGVAAGPGPFEAMGLVRFDGGIRAPAFSRPGLDGAAVTVAPGSGIATLLVFWATW